MCSRDNVIVQTGEEIPNGRNFVDPNTIAEPDVSRPSKCGACTPQKDHPAFRIVHTECITEVSSTVTHYRHKLVGLELMVILPCTPGDCASVGSQCTPMVGVAGDSGFSLGLRTPDHGTNGAAHVVQHCALYGSRKYPWNNPLEILKTTRFSNIHHGACTAFDFSSFYVTSSDQNDLSDLISVLLDGIFFPSAMKDSKHNLIFKREAWHYTVNRDVPQNIVNLAEVSSTELPSPSAPKLNYGGHVYREMQENYIGPMQLLRTLHTESLFTGECGVNPASGNPSLIPKLDFQTFVDYHNKYYYPGNVKAVLWGMANTMATLDIIDDFMKDWLAARTNQNGGVDPVVDAEEVWKSTNALRPKLLEGKVLKGCR
eukprot:GHVT01030899.1.p2 GENE.GHVT01030899.1~~GHVT01030899.1.p2  ORF type:complete len:371 (+),score=23.61 GHVT01030899.1:675-1787(+)